VQKVEVDVIEAGRGEGLGDVGFRGFVGEFLGWDFGGEEDGGAGEGGFEDGSGAGGFIAVGDGGVDL
jgi:hypothetical protein